MASVLVRHSLAVGMVVVAAVSVTAGAGRSSKSLNISNSCVHTVWPEISSSAAANTTGFELAPGQWEVVAVPSEWSGRVWGRTLCSSSTTTAAAVSSSGHSKFTCVTGGPVTLAEFTLDGGSGGGVDSYDVSLVDGFNLPVMVAPQQQQGGAAPAGGNKDCAPTGCMADMNGVGGGGGGACPPELRVITSGAVACKSACQALGSPEYCCTGEYGTPDTCKPSAYSELFKKACPMAVSYPYDDGADSIFKCGGGGGGGNTTYAITFCPSKTTSSGDLSSSPNSHPPAGTTTGNLPHINGTTPTYTAGGSSQQVAGAADMPPWRITFAVAVLGLATAALGFLLQFFGLFKRCGTLLCSNPGPRVRVAS